MVALAALDGVGRPRADAVLIQGINPACPADKEIRQSVTAITAFSSRPSMMLHMGPGRSREMIMLILSIAVFVATLATPVVVLALWQHFEVRELGRQVRAIQW